MSSTDSPEAEPAPETEAAAEAEAADTEVAESDPVRDGIVQALQAKLGDDLLSHEVAAGDVWVRVATEAWRQAGQACKDLGFDYFCFLSGIDWLPNPDLAGEKVWDPDAAPSESTPLQTGVTCGASRFQVFARVFSTRRKIGITLKADLDADHPTVESWTLVYGGADWHEREAWEMFGFTFVGHPGLRHIYLPTEFEGNPLRKDFPLLAREVKPWPGLVDVEPIPGDDEPGEGEVVPEEVGDE